MFLVKVFIQPCGGAGVGRASRSDRVFCVLVKVFIQPCVFCFTQFQAGESERGIFC